MNRILFNLIILVVIGFQFAIAFKAFKNMETLESNLSKAFQEKMQ